MVKSSGKKEIMNPNKSFLKLLVLDVFITVKKVNNSKCTLGCKWDFGVELSEVEHFML